MKKTGPFFACLFILLLAARLCHMRVLWTEETLPLAAAAQMLRGKALYHDIWFDKPPLWPLLYVLWGAPLGWVLRLMDAAYVLVACWVSYRFARAVWSEREGMWAAALLAFFLTFYLPSAVLPVASDLLMLAPHVAAVWLAFERRPLWSGVLAGVAFWINPKGVFVLAACALWDSAAIPLLALGFAAVSAAAAGWLWSAGALADYWSEVWRWGSLYAASTFLENPLRNAAGRTMGWLGFHAAIVLAAAVAMRQEKNRLAWTGWLLLSIAGVAAGWRFFPRYFFLLLPPVVLLAARALTVSGRCRIAALLLLLIPLARFGPRYITLALHGEEGWADTAMDRDSRAAAAILRRSAQNGETLFVWGYRPELYVYTRLPAANRFLDSQPLTGVPADRHLIQSEPVETEMARTHRIELVRSWPVYIADGLSLYNPKLAMSIYPDLRDWFAHYREIGRSGQTIVYRLVAGP